MIHSGGKHSQSNEDVLIEQYFAGRTGTLLDLGANDGASLSNTLAAIERGWTGVLVEPSQTAFNKLESLHKERKEVYCFQVAIGDKAGMQDFYESGTHLGTGDTALISTLRQSETERWRGSKYDNFTLTKVEVMRWPDFYSLIPIKTFNLISIDCEGEELNILRDMNLTELGCEMLIVEWNSKDREKFDALILPYGLKYFASNMENLIYIK